MRHLGTRASALLDGQLPDEEADRLWEHVHGCHACRDLVEREGWIKTQLSGLGGGGAPLDLKGSLKGTLDAHPALPTAHSAGDLFLTPAAPSRVRRSAGVALTAGSAAGMAVLGVLALGAAPADAPTVDRRAPVANLTPVRAPSPVPTRAPLPLPVSVPTSGPVAVLVGRTDGR